MMKFLVVEDNTSAQKLLDKILSKFGEVDLYGDAEEALAQFAKSKDQNTPYDIIFVDFQLPGMNGDQLVKKIRELESEGDRIPISITSGIANEKDLESCNLCGADWSIYKPYDQSEIVKFIEACQNSQ